LNKPSLSNLKYSRKVLLIISVIFVLAAASIFISYRASRNGLLEGHREHLDTASRLTEDLLEQKEAELRRLVDLFQNNRLLIEYLYIATVLGGGKEPVLEMLRPVYISQKIDILELYDMKGRPVGGLDTGGGIGHGRDEGGMYEGPDRETVSGFRQKGPAAVISSSGPLLYAGKTAGYIAAGKYMDGEFLSELRKVAGVELLFVRGDVVVASSLHPDRLPYAPERGSVRLKGETYSVGELKLQGLDGTVVAALSDKALMGSLKRLRLTLFALLGVSLALSLGFAVLFIKALASPVKQMVSVVEKVGKGEFDRMLEVKGKDEIAVLSSRFNEMQRQLNAQRQALDRYTAGLEYAVEERTKELERAQQQLLQVQKMESMGTLAGGIAHDFNNLLSAILGYASFVKEQIDESHPHYRYWDIVEQAALRGTELTGHLLTFARGRFELGAKEPVDVSGLLRELMALLGRTFDKSISIEMKQAEEGLYIMGDQNALYQALLNICVNARDAMPSGGRLIIETAAFDAAEDFVVGHLQARPGRYVQVSVSDTGVGMEKAVVERIFEPFFTTKELGRGTGLGLSITYSVIKAHGGFIDVYSAPGKGTTFKLYLPAYGEKIAAAPEEEAEVLDAATPGAMLLVVDDEEPLRNLCKEMLEAAGYKVLTAENGAEALKLFEREKSNIALIVLDLIMPVMSGHEVFRRLRAIEPPVKVLISSGFSKEVGATLAGEKGIAGFVQKPYRSRILLKAVKDALAQNKLKPQTG